MIDTVVLRFHGIAQGEPHERLAEWLNRTHTRTGKTVTMTPSTDQAHTVTAQILHRTTLHYHDTGNVQQVAHYNQLASSHYTIAYKIDIIRQFVEINLSIPKYIFGTNILLFNRPHTSKLFFAAKHCELGPNLAEAYKRLGRFLEKFFATEFGTIELDNSKIEINRIDICYNQVFDSKDDALDYLNQLRKLKKKNARDSTNYSRDWKTSIVYKTDRYSFKVYHKGSEFAKNDSKKLHDINERGKHSFTFPVAYYQQFADRILRYEMTLRNTQLSYLYMNHLFRADCYIWQAGIALYKQEKQKKQHPDKFATWRAGLTRDEVKLLAYVNERVNKTKHFFLAVDSRSARFDEETSEARFTQWPGKPERFDYYAPFSSELWALLTGQFLRVLDEFKLEVHQDHHSVLAKADAYNKKILSDREKLINLGFDKKTTHYQALGETITISKLKIILKMLETQTFEEIADSNVFARATWYRHRKTLQQLGLTQVSQLSVAMRADHDLKNYNTEVLFNSSKFVNLSF